MEPYVVLSCPICGRRRLLLGQETSKDQLLQAIAAHVLDEHPEMGPNEAELVLELAIKVTTVEAFDPEAIEPMRWVRLDG